MKTDTAAKAAHTSTPWKVLPGTYNGDYKIVMDDKRWANPHQSYVMTCGNDQQANAAYIVRAVNAHEELLAACKAALERWGKMPGTGEVGTPNKVGDMLVKALARAEEK